MKDMNFFTIYDVRKINQNRINRTSSNLTDLTPISQKFVRETRFTGEDINQAFAAARNSIKREIA